MARPSILVFGGSLRNGSFSAKLAALAARELTQLGAEVNHISLRDFPLPIYDADLEQEKGAPEAAKQLRALMNAHRGIYIATPEYNASLPPLLKNAIDWTSRPASGGENPYRRCVFALGSTSNGRFGGYRALIALRQVLELGLGALVLPAQVAIVGAADAFDAEGTLKDERSGELLRASLTRLVNFAGAEL